MANAIQDRVALRRENPDIATRPQQAAEVSSEQVWQELRKASFAVIGYATPAGQTRSSGVVCKTVGGRLYFAVAPDSWKARHIASSRQVSVTVPVRRGGLLTLLMPIPPATISFHATAIVHPAGKLPIGPISKELGALIPKERRDAAVLIEVTPVGDFLAYGIGVPLLAMQHPDLARAVVPVSNRG
jgi:hypothetical protein